MNDLERFNMQQPAIFPVDEPGRRMFAEFAKQNRIINWMSGQMVNQGKVEPALWVLFLPGKDPYLSQENMETEPINEPIATEPPKEIPKKTKS